MIVSRQSPIFVHLVAVLVAMAANCADIVVAASSHGAHVHVHVPPFPLTSAPTSERRYGRLPMKRSFVQVDGDGTQTQLPTSAPTSAPTAGATYVPTFQPTTIEVSIESRHLKEGKYTCPCPTRAPTTRKPTLPPIQPLPPRPKPTHEPSRKPTLPPIQPLPPKPDPTDAPSRRPSVGPSGQPSESPSTLPSASPSALPSPSPSVSPKPSPKDRTAAPSSDPSVSSMPSSAPSSGPTESFEPSNSPSASPTLSSMPSRDPSSRPSVSPKPSMSGTHPPSVSSMPSSDPSHRPSVSREPSDLPSATPSVSSMPSRDPSSRPSVSPKPSISGSHPPSVSSMPSSDPSQQPSVSREPSDLPSATPSVSSMPSRDPSSRPSVSSMPSDVPSSRPSVSSMPSTSPSAGPSVSSMPSDVPSSRPSVSSMPSDVPSSTPSVSSMPSSSPTVFECPDETVSDKDQGIIYGKDVHGIAFPQSIEFNLATSATTSYGKACVDGMIGISPPFNFMFVIDVSGSTSQQFEGTEVGDINGDGVKNTILDAELDSVIKAIKGFVDAPSLTNDNVNIGIVTFSTDATYRGSWTPADPNNPKEMNPSLVAMLKTLTPRGTTHFDDALDKSIRYFANDAPDVGTRTNVMYFLSDGLPNRCGDDDPGTAEDDCEGESRTDNNDPGAIVFESELKKLKQYGVSIHAIGVGSGSDVSQGSGLAKLDTTQNPLTGVNVTQVTTTDELTALILQSPIFSEVLELEVKLNGMVLPFVNASHVRSTPTGYAFGTTIVTGLDPTKDVKNNITATVLLDVDGKRTTTSDQLRLSTETNVLGTVISSF